MRFQATFLCLMICLLIVLPVSTAATDKPADDAVTVTVRFAHVPMEPEPVQPARALALFGARYNAAVIGEEALVERRLLVPLGERRQEILCLAADRLDAVMVEETVAPETGRFEATVEARVRPQDFIQAQIADRELEAEERHLTYSEEMEQPVLSVIAPGKELARAYLYLREQRWRIAVIYLDHLQRKYPNWGEVSPAKAEAYERLHQSDRMRDALDTACRLHRPEACEKLRDPGRIDGPPAD